MVDFYFFFCIKLLRMFKKKKKNLLDRNVHKSSRAGHEACEQRLKPTAVVGRLPFLTHTSTEERS